MGKGKILNEGKGGELVGQFFHYHLFSGLPRYIGNLVGAEGTINILKGVAREAMIRAIRESKIIKGLIEGKSFHEVFLTCYKIYAQLGYKFKAEKVEETPEKYIAKVTECPHLKFTKENPIACFSCYGIKQGVLSELLGHVPVINIKKRMAVGDPFCLFEVLKGKKEELLTI